MARETFIDNPAEEDKNCSVHNIITLLQNEEGEEELDVVLASTDSTAAAAGTVHVDHAGDVANLLQWLNDYTGGSWDDINAIDDGWTALDLALMRGASWEVINGLLGNLDEKVINAIDEDGRTALHYACHYGASWEVINGLLGKLDEKAINAITKYGRSALHIACKYGASWEVINGLLGKLDEKAINAIDMDGDTALQIAWNDGASSEVMNAIINASKGIEGTELHKACMGGASPEVINGLLDKLDEEAFKAIDKNGDTALHYAWMHGRASWEVINAIMTWEIPSIKNCNGNEKDLSSIKNQLPSVKNKDEKLPFNFFPDDKEERDEHLKKILKLHDLMEANDPNASLYPNQLLQSILNLPSEDRDEFEFLNHSYFRKTINAKIIRPFSLSILFLDVAVQGLVMAVFSFTINGAVKELPTTSMAGLIPCLLWLLFREIVQFSSATTKFYFGDAANFVDIIQIVLIIAALLISFIGKASIDEGLLVACIGVAWTRLIFVISNLHYSLALFVAALLQVSSSWYIEFTILAMM
jgi:ankyrin repeat protein